MKAHVAVMCLALFAAVPVHAAGPGEGSSKAEFDKYDAEQKRKTAEQAAREARESRQGLAKQKAELVAAHRQLLGKDAVGKSDAQVEAMFAKLVGGQQARMSTLEADSAAALKKVDTLEKEHGAQRDAILKQHTGHTMKDIGSMSDAEIDKAIKDLEKQPH